MHILFLTDNFPPEVNAPASRTFEHCREWVRMGHEVSVLTCFPNFPYGKVYDGYKNTLFQKERLDGIQVYRLWSYMAPNKGFFKRTLDFMSFMVSGIIGSCLVEDPNVVIATSPQFFAGVAGYVVAKLKRRPFVYEVRDLWPEQILVVGVMKHNAIVRFLFRLARFMYHHADRVVVLGQGYKEQVQNCYEVPDEVIAIVPNGILPDLFSINGSRNEFRRQLGWDGKFVVLYLGTHGLSQKLETVMATAELLIDDPGIVFAFVGDGAEKEKLMQIKEEKNLTNCSFFAMQPKDKVPAFYEAADACVIPLRACDLFQGNYPSKMFEAMAMQCPIILSAEGASAALLAKAGAGIAVPPENPLLLAEAVRHLHKHPDERVRMGEAGRKFVLSNYSREFWAKHYLELMQHLVQV